ncbi:MAG TPA: MarC family protein [Dehalococcoidales bacterium]|nr:MarC family protein [Dehalococcoidales bacterium]
MQTTWEILVLTFIQLFIVVDAPGNLPIVVSLTEGLTNKERNKVIHIAIITATIVGLVFLFFGAFILKVLGLHVGSLTIAGGIIIFVLSIRYIMSGHWGQYEETNKEEMLAIVPIGTPLVVGPATITTLLLFANSFNYPLWIIVISLAANLLISWVVFLVGGRIAAFLGKGGLKAMSQIFNLLMAAIAVNMVIRGLSLLGIINVPGLG